MSLYHTTDAQGISELNPDADKMREILSSLDSAESAEEEHPDVSLVHDATGWSISVFPSGIITLENLDSDEPPKFMSDVSRRDSLQLWIDLSKGKITRILSRPWQSDE